MAPMKQGSTLRRMHGECVLVHGPYEIRLITEQGLLKLLAVEANSYIGGVAGEGVGAPCGCGGSRGVIGSISVTVTN